MHISLSNILSYSILAGAGSLAFFVAFQATWLASYPAIQAALVSKAMMIGSVNLPLGKIAVSSICLFILVFNYWSYQVTVLFAYYVRAFLISGAALEKSAQFTDGPYGSIFEGFERYGHQGRGSHSALSVWTLAVVLVISLVWLVLAALAWVA
jgi:hypothetical protein